MKKNNKQVSTIERLSPKPEEGLSTFQVQERVKLDYVNKIGNKQSKSYWNILANNLCTFFNLLGLIVTIALIFAKAPLSSFFYVVIYLSNIAIGIIQEIRAKKSVDKLSLVANKTIKVIRDGNIVDISADQIVLDDIIYLGIGSQIPTDSIIIEGDIEVNESLLTGESIPVKKSIGDKLLAGSFIVSGTCKVRADKIGKENYVEILSNKAKEYKKPTSEIMSSLRKIIKTIGIVIVPVGIAWIVKGLLNPNSNINEAILGSSTVVIGMIPSGMFLLTSVALAVGIIKLAKHNTLVQDLYSLETLARVDTICFDKTGTITDGKMTVKDVIILDNNYSSSIHDIMSSMINALQDNNQTAIALYEYFGESNKLSAKEVIHFNSARKLSAVSFENGKTFSYGAPEFVLDKDNYKKVQKTVDEYAHQGLRVLTLASSKTQIKNDVIPTDFSPIALILIADNIRQGAIDTIKWFKENDVKIKVISGDNPITVAEVSKRAGIDDADKYISLEGLSDEEVINIANEYTVFGRVSPEQKAILISAMKSNGHVTAMTGDGVNDILAMKKSDCAISVAAGSDAARNVAHLVLLDNNFNSIPNIVYEGRRVINNVQSSASLFLMKTLYTMLLSLVILFLPQFPDYPFRLQQMILVEVFIIGIPSFILSLQPNDERVKGKFIGQVVQKTLPSALLMFLSVITIYIFRFSLNTFNEDIYNTMSIFALTLAGLVSLFNICRPLNKLRTLLFASSSIIVIGVILIAIISGFEVLGLNCMLPLSKYWHHLLIIITLLILDFIIFSPLQKLFTKIKINK